MSHRTAAPSPRATAAKGPITRAEHVTFRATVFQELRRRGGVYHGTVRAFALALHEAHGPQRPFEASVGKANRSNRIEGRLRRLERPEGAIKFTWGRSQAYDVVTEIRLVESAATPEPPRRRVARAGHATAEARTRRQMDILACLEAVGGRTEGRRALLADLTQRFRDQRGSDDHRMATLDGDLAVLRRQRAIRREAIRVRGRPGFAFSITARGRKVLAAHRRANDHVFHGTPARRAAPTAAALTHERVTGVGARSLAVLHAIDALSTPEAPAVTPTAIYDFLCANDAAHDWRAGPSGEDDPVQLVRYRLRDLASGGYTERRALTGGRTSYALTNKAFAAFVNADAPASAPTTPAPRTAPPHDAPTVVPAPTTVPSPTAPTREDIVRAIAVVEAAIDRAHADADAAIAHAAQEIGERAEARVRELGERLQQLRAVLVESDTAIARAAALLCPAPEDPRAHAEEGQ